MIEREIEMNSSKEILAQRPKLTIKKKLSCVLLINPEWIWKSGSLQQEPRIAMRTEFLYSSHKPKKSWNWRNPAFSWRTTSQSCQLMRFQDITSYSLLNEKTNITISFQKIDRVVAKRLFLALSQQDDLNPTNLPPLADSFWWLKRLQILIMN